MSKTAAEPIPVTEEPVGDDGLIGMDSLKPAEEPKPGDAGYDWAQHYGTDKLYTHTFPDGKVVALKTFDSIFNKTWMYKIRKLQTNIDIQMAALDRGACDVAQEILEGLDDSGDNDPIDDLYSAWSKAVTSNGDGDEGLTPGN
jgi:hypothetical protein